MDKCGRPSSNIIDSPMSFVAWRSQVLKCQTLTLVNSTRRNMISIAGHWPISYTLWRQCYDSPCGFNP
jgi:hypothetical protein